MVLHRLFILREIYAKALATPPGEHIAEWMKSWDGEDRNQFVTQFGVMFVSREKQIRTAGLWELMSEDERRFIQAGVLAITEQQRIDASWLAESMVSMLWALGRVEHLPGYDEETSHELIQLHTGVSALEPLKQAVIRPTLEIERQRDWAELWHWRCRTRMLLETNKIAAALPNGTTMAEIIKMASAKASEEGVFDSPIGEDFPTFGKPFREMTAAEFASVNSIAKERRKAFNWLCGYAPGNLWAETPTDT